MMVPLLFTLASCPSSLSQGEDSVASPSDIVRLAYRGLLGREPDAGGMRTYRRFLEEEHESVVWLCTVLTKVGPSCVSIYIA